MRPRGRLAAAAVLLATLLSPPAAPPAHAHDYPLEVTVEVGQSVTFDVTDAADCEAFITATSQNPELFTITPESGDAVSVTFTVHANATTPGTGTAIVSWVGEDVGGEGDCKEISGPRPITVRVVARPRRTSTASTPAAGESGDPVNTFNGELWFPEDPDLDLGGRPPIRFDRYYASGLARSFIAGAMGVNWRHSFEWELSVSDEEITIVDPRGRVDRHALDGVDWEPADPGTFEYRLSEDGSEFLVMDPSTGLVRRFDSAGRLTSVADAGGRTLVCMRSLDGRLSLVKDDTPGTPHLALRFTHDGNGLLTQVREERDGVPRRSVTFTYADGLLVSATDAAGKTTTYEYDDIHVVPGLLEARVRPEGNAPLRQTWDAQGRVATQVDPDGNVTRFDYGNPNKPGTTRVTLPGGGVVTYEHDARGNLVAQTEATGRKRTFGNDDGVRRTSVRTPGGTETTSEPTAEGLPGARTDGAGLTETWSYGSATAGSFSIPVATGLARDDGTTVGFQRDPGGLVIGVTDEAGQAWSFPRHGSGEIGSAEGPLGDDWVFTRNTHGELTGVTDPAGRPSTFTLDTHGRTATITRPGGATRTLQWDALDRLVGLVDEEGRTVTRTYDDNGRLVQVQWSDVSVGFEYDASDRLVTLIDAAGGRTTLEYDERGFLVGRTHPDGTSDSFTLDDEGNVTGGADRAGGAWSQAPGDDGDAASITDPLGGRTTFTRDGEGRVLSRTDADGHVETFTRDAQGRVIAHVDGSGVRTEMDRDARGDVARWSVGGLVEAEYVRDASGRLVSATSAGATWSFAYDLSARLTSRTDPLGRTTSYAYDARGNLSETTYPGALGTLDITSDRTDRVVGRSYSDGPEFVYDLNARGHLMETIGIDLSRNARDEITASGDVTHGRDSMGRMTTAVIAPGRTVTYGYDARGLLTSVSDGAGGTMNLSRDAMGRLTQITRSSGVTTSFERDAAGRPTRISEGTLSSLTLLRDGAGRVIEEIRDLPLDGGLEFDPLAPAGFDAAHQATDRTHDAMGRTLSDGTRTFEWDLAGRCTSLDDGDTERSFSCDAMGLLLASGADEYTWSWGYTRPAVVASVRGGATRLYVRDPEGNLLWSTNGAGGDRRWYHFDAAGSTLFLTDDAGTVTDAFAYGPFGEPAGRTGTHDTPFTFGGRHGVMLEDAAGIYRMGRRLYDARVRTFLSPDWIVSAVTPFALHPYLYANGDPLSMIDPTGEVPEVSAGDAANASGLGGEILSRLGKALGGWTTGGKVLGAAGDVGGLLGAVGAPLEVMNGNDRMDQVIDRYRRDNENARSAFDNAMEHLRRALKRREITYDEYTERRRRLQDLLNDRYAANTEDFNVNTAINATVTSMNIVTGYVPGGGFLVNWADHYGFNNLVR